MGRGAAAGGRGLVARGREGRSSSRAATLAPHLHSASALLVPSLQSSASSCSMDLLNSYDALIHLDSTGHGRKVRGLCRTVTLAPHFRSTSALLVPTMLQSSASTVSIRSYSSESHSALTHLDSEGRARMVDVGGKEITARIAEAECSLRVGGRLLRLLRDARLPKGDALTVAQIAGVVGAKKTSEIIPMCHPLPLDCVRIKIQLPKGECHDGGHIAVHCEVRATARTGAEMEALTGAATAALTLYDMCKSVDKNMRVTNLRVIKKTGGKSGDWPREPEPEVKVRELNKAPIKPDEAYVPANLMHI